MQNLSDILKKHNLWANKTLGQHFLHDTNVCNRMVSHLNLKDQVVVEIGPGPGSLTYVLNELPLKASFAIEKDQRFIEVLNEITAGNKNFNLINADALKVNISEVLQNQGITQKFHIIANLPYNIGTELLIQWIQEIENIESITVMLQKEVVDRIRAKPDKKDYGRLSVIMQSCFKVQELFRIPKGAFIPPPKVLSSVVYLKPLKEIQPLKTLDTLGIITQLAFSKRRKMLRSSLGKSLPEKLWTELCDKLKIDEALRPEVIKPEIFLEMAKLCQHKI